MNQSFTGQLAHRYLNERHRIRLAKTMAAVGGTVWAYVKLYRRTYTLDLDEDTGEFTTTRAGRHWSGPHWALTLGTIHPEAVDPDHYAHWAYIHQRCTARCEVCGGMACSGGGCGWPPDVPVINPLHRQTRALRFGRRHHWGGLRRDGPVRDGEHGPASAARALVGVLVRVVVGPVGAGCMAFRARQDGDAPVPRLRHHSLNRAAVSGRGPGCGRLRCRCGTGTARRIGGRAAPVRHGGC